MSDIDRDNAGTRNTATAYRHRAAADAAVSDLVAAGFPREQISITGNGAPDATMATNDRSFWEELKGLFLPAEDRYAYAEGLRRGGLVVSVHTEEATYSRALEILDRDGAVRSRSTGSELAWRGSERLSRP